MANNSIVKIAMLVLFVLIISGCANKPTDTITNSSEPGLATLQTTVVDKVTNEPVQNAIVNLGIKKCYTDNGGKCLIEHLSGGDWFVHVYKKGYESYREPIHCENGSKFITIELDKLAEVPMQMSVKGKVIKEVTAKGTRSENTYLKIPTDDKQEYYLFNEVWANTGFDEFVNKKVNVEGYRGIGTIGWEGQDAEGIYVEKIDKI